MELPFAESWRIKMVEPIRKSTREEREQWIKAAHYNVFQLPAEQVYIDLLTDSGTGAMSDRQWAAMMTGDESYAGARSFFNMKNAVERITGFPIVIPTHQGRAAENVLFSALVKEGDIVPGNSHFDTTKGHIESRKAFAVDCTIDEAKDTQLEHPFKGNVDIDKLEKAVSENPGRVPFIIVTITNNTAGGQPVSMANLKAVRELADRHNLRVIFDSARFAENAYFIKMREEGYADKSIKEIVREMFALADGMTMSAKKDAIVNMGGFFATRHEDWADGARRFAIRGCSYAPMGTSQIFIDNVSFYPTTGAPQDLTLKGYNIYCGNTLINAAPVESLSFAELPAAGDTDKEYAVSAVYTTGESRAVKAVTGTGVDSSLAGAVKVAGGKGVISLSGMSGQSYSIVSASGMAVAAGEGNGHVDIPAAQGVYRSPTYPGVGSKGIQPTPSK